MSLLVNLTTESDQDFSFAFAYVQADPPWDAALYYATNDRATYGGKWWKAAANNNNVVPGSDGTKWTLDAAVPIDLTGSTLLMQARSPVYDEYAPVSLTSAGSGGGITLTDAVNGKFTLTIPNATLQKMPAGDYTHSLIRLRPDGLRELVWRGTLTHSVGPTQ